MHETAVAFPPPPLSFKADAETEQRFAQNVLFI